MPETEKASRGLLGRNFSKMWKCPKCNGLVQYGKWELITLLDSSGQLHGWRVEWVKSDVLLCPNGDKFEVVARKQ